jgi:hypothetical protein
MSIWRRLPIRFCPVVNIVRQFLLRINGAPEAFRVLLGSMAEIEAGRLISHRQNKAAQSKVYSLWPRLLEAVNFNYFCNYRYFYYRNNNFV